MTLFAGAAADDEERSFTTKGATTRGRIVEAARTMLIERGYDGLVLRELAESLGLTLGNLQYYFKTRESVAMHVLKVEGTRDADLVKEQRRAGQPVDAFRMVVRDMADRYRGDSGRLLSLISALAQHHESFRVLYRDSYMNFYPEFEALLRDLRPDLSSPEITARARVINALVEGSAFQIEVGEIDAFLDRIVDEAEQVVLRTSGPTAR